MNEEDCLEIGGHCWNYYTANDVVDERGNKTGVRYLMLFPKGEPRYRRCKHCGFTQRYHEEWIEEG